MKFLAAILAATIALLSVGPASADGINLRLRRVSGAPPVVAYNPGGVLFWPEASGQFIGAGNLNAGTDTTHGIVAYRVRTSRGYPTASNPPDNWRISNSFGNLGDGTCNSEGCAGVMFNSDNASWVTNGTGFVIRQTLGGVNDGSPPNPGQVLAKSNIFFDNAWTSIVVFYDTSARKQAVFQDGALIATQSDYTQGGSGTYNVNWNNTRGVCINGCNRGSGLPTGGTLEIADQIVDTVNALPSGCPATPASCQAVVDAYYKSGAPVSPGTTAVNCDLFRASYSAASKTDWCFRGDKTNFLANTDGNAQILSATNLVASSPTPVALYNSQFGQGNVPTDAPYLVWSALSQSTISTSSNTSCAGAGCTSSVMGNYGGEIITGDQLFAVWTLCYTSTVPSVTLPTAPSGWTFVSSSTTTNPANDAGSNQRCQWAVYTHTASANYIANNTPWVTGNPFVDPPTFTYTSTGTIPRDVKFLLFDYRSATGAVLIDASDFVSINRTALANASYVTPTITTTKATETLVELCGMKEGNTTLTPAASADLRHTSPFGAAGINFVILASEKLTSSGATGTRTFTQNGTATTNDRAYCGLMGLANN